MRSTLTMIGMAVAVGAVVAFVGISDGFSRSMLELYQRRGVSLVVSRSDSVNPLAAALPESVGAEIAALEDVEAVCPGLVDIVSFENLGLNTIAMQGWPADSYMFGELELLEGERLSEAYRGKNGVMLGKDLAEGAKLKVGATVDIFGEDYHVVGIYQTFSSMENKMAIMLLEDAQKALGKTKQITGCTVKVRNATPENVEKVQARIEGELAEKLHLKSKLRAAPPDAMIGSNTQIRAAKAMAWTTSALALLISAIFVLTTMYTSVFERTREIGILRAIGWRPGRVMRMILMESLILSIVGGIVGTVGALGLIWFLSRLPWVNGAIPSTAPPHIIVIGFLIALLVGLIGAAYPAYRGSRLLPTEALRHE